MMSIVSMIVAIILKVLLFSFVAKFTKKITAIGFVIASFIIAPILIWIVAIGYVFFISKKKE